MSASRYRSRMPSAEMMEESHRHYVRLHMHQGVGAMIMWFILFTFASYAALRVVKPWFVKVNKDDANADPYWTLIFSMIMAVAALVVLAVLARN